MAENKELKDIELDKVLGGKMYPVGTNENNGTDENVDIERLENLTDNKGADE